MPTRQTNPLKKTNKNSCPKALMSWATAFVLCCSLFSCSATISDETISIENGQWAETDSILFTFDIQDTIQLYDMFLEIDHSVDYAYQNIYCEVRSLTPDGLLAQHQLVPLELATPKGKWKGVCGSESCQRNIPFIRRSQFPTTGTYTVILKQYTRDETLEGINSLRLKVQATEASNS